MLNRNKFYQDNIYHLFNKSIANYRIFNNEMNINRFINIIEYYNNANNKLSFSIFIKRYKKYIFDGLLLDKIDNITKILGYCIMPDHYHLLIKIQSSENISSLISNIENSYSRFLNIKAKRKGPLWQSRFKSVIIRSNEQLLHVLRYIHLNPTTANLVVKPEDWPYSSYQHYINNPLLFKKNSEISINSVEYLKKFTEDNIDYQKQLKRIKKMLLEEPIHNLRG